MFLNISSGGKGSDSCPNEHSETWQVLDRLVRELQGDAAHPGPLRRTMEAIREAIDAAVVYLHERCVAGAPEIVGGVERPPRWYREAAEALLTSSDAATVEAGRVLRPALPTRSNSPRSAAMVLLSRSRGAWIVALNFDRGRSFRPADLDLMHLAKRLLVAQSRQVEAQVELKETLFGLIQCLAATIDAKDSYTAGHSERVARVAVRLGQEMQLAEGGLSNLYLAGLLHDVGKIGIRDEVLQKPGRLTDAEMAHVREHPIVGDRILAHIRKLDYLRAGVRHHHERYDGRGYPDGLAGEAIPEMARVLAVADASDAMRSCRRYRAAMSPQRIEAILLDGRGTQWDPAVVDAFLACSRDIEPIARRGLGDSVYRAVGRLVGTLGDASLWQPPAPATPDAQTW